jgi:hypothetical protein
LFEGSGCLDEFVEKVVVICCSGEKGIPAREGDGEEIDESVD